MITDNITKQAKNALENSIYNAVKKNGAGLPNPVARAIVSRAAEELAVLISGNVIKTTNKQLDDIPKNLIGNKNPVDLNTQNLGSSGIAKNLENILQTQVSSQATNKLVSVLEAELKKALPTNSKNLINFAGLASTVVQAVTPTINKSISDTLGSVTKSIFSSNRKPPVTVNNIDLFFSNASSEDALDRIQDQYSNSLANESLREASNFNIDNTENKEKLAVLTTGFTDPSANYPKADYKDLPETNKLAQGDIKGTVVQKKNNSRMLGAKLPGGSSWDQPESPYKGEYPYNKVTESESGHIIEIDDTPGSERIHIYHRSGTFVEIDANGSVVKRAIGSSYEIIDRNGRIAIAGKAEISVNGACNIFIGNDANIEVEGDTSITCHNDITAQAGGKLNLSATEEINITSNKINIQSFDDMNIKSDKSIRYHSAESSYFKSNADILVQSVNSYEKYSASKFVETSGDVNFKSVGNFNADGNRIELNSNTSSGSKDSEQASSSNIGILSGRKTTTDNSKVDPLFLTLVDKSSLLLEEEGQTGTEYLSHKDLIITSGFATATEFESAPLTVEKSDVETKQGNLIFPNEKLKAVKELPGNYNLSQNFTVEMLSYKAAVTRDKIQGSDNASFGEIVYNLQALALNILEPVYKLYPNMFVTSAYRNPGNQSNSKTSQHPLGQAADIQFKGISKSEYYTIAQQLGKVLNYDQLILEYCNYVNNPWIHISFSIKNRNQVLTFFNHKKHSEGLSQLA